MADFGSPVAQNVNPVGQGMQTLSDVMGFKRQQQALQTGVYQQQSAQADAQQAQQRNGELQQAQQLLKQVHGGGYRDKNGNLDSQKLTTDLASIGPYAGESASRIIGIGNDIVTNQKALQGLTEETRGQIGNVVNSLATNPGTKARDVTDAVTDWIADHGNDPNAVRVGKGIIHTVGQLQDGPQLRTALSNIAGEMTGKPQGAPSTVDNGASVQPGQTLGATGQFTPSGQPIPKQLPPGADIVTDAYGRQFRFNRQDNTVSPVGAGAPSAAPGGFQQPVAGQQQVMQDVENARAVGDQAPGVRNVNQQLLQLSSDTKTGPGTQTAQKIAAFLGLPSGSNYQEINAYLDRQAAMQARAMGVPHTNAGLAAAQSASGTTEYTPQALQEKVKFADALNSGTIAYRQGLDKAVGTGATPDLTKYQAFRSAWAKNFDPDVYRAEDAIRRGDNAELNSLRKRLGPKGMKDLATKSANLRGLENGEVPGG